MQMKVQDDIQSMGKTPQLGYQHHKRELIVMLVLINLLLIYLEIHDFIQDLKAFYFLSHIFIFFSKRPFEDYCTGE